MRVLIVALVLSYPPIATAREDAKPEPSLADRAKKAREGKPAPGSGGKVYTNEDLKNAKGNIIILHEPPTTPEEDKAKAENAQKKVDTDSIQGKIDALVGRVARTRKSMADAQKELDGLAVSASERRITLNRYLEDARVELNKDEESITNLEADAKRQGLSVSRP